MCLGLSRVIEINWPPGHPHARKVAGLALLVLATLTKVRREFGRRGASLRQWRGSSVEEPTNQGRLLCGLGDGLGSWVC